MVKISSSFTLRNRSRHITPLFVFLTAVLSLMAHSPAKGVDLVGAFQLDATNYEALEGTALTVTVRRVGGGILDRDIQVKVAMADGTEDFDYTPGQQSLIFPIGTNLSSKQANFQTLNQDRAFDKNVTVKILSVGGGTIGVPSASNVKILGSRVLRINSVFPRSAVPGTPITIRGTGFLGRRDVQKDEILCDAASNVLDGVFFGPVQANGCTLLSDSEMVVIYPGGAVPGANTVKVLRPVLGADLLPIPGQNDQAELKDVFWPASSLAIHSLTPSSGPSIGGNTIEIRGQGFTPTSRVFFRPTPLQPVMVEVEATKTFISTVQINAIVPPGTLPMDVQVRDGALGSPVPAQGAAVFNADARYTYLFGPAVNSISPKFGSVAGGTEVTILGANFSEACAVFFGPTQAVATLFNSQFKLVAISPAGTGAVDVTVVCGTAVSPNTLADDFSYSGPAIKEIVPNAGPPAGGTKVSIRGSNFTATSIVFFGPMSVTSEFVSPEEIRLTTKPGRGSTSVRIFNASGQSPEHAAAVFTFTDGPIVESLNPSFGSSSGGTAVVITGKNFAPDASVLVSGLKVTSVNVNSDKVITFITPAAPGPGMADVMVVTGKGESPVSADSRFNYISSPPAVLALVPDTGPTGGGTEVTIVGTGFLGAACPGNGVMFGLVPAVSCTVVDGNKIVAITPPHFAATVIVTVATPNGASQLTDNFTYKTSGGSPPPPGGGGAGPSNLTYTLSYRWTLFVWAGPDAVDIASALKGTSSVVISENISALVFGVYEWDASTSTWITFINAPIPGISDLLTFKRGAVYWIGLSQPVTIEWNVVTR
jgi:hypothetical protein